MAASAASATLSGAPVFRSRLATCFSTVRGESTSSAAISRFDIRTPRRRSTSASRLLTPRERRWSGTGAPPPISAAKLQAKIGRTLDVIIDAVDEDGGATGRSKADAPEIDGEVHLRDAGHLKAGDIVRVEVEDADEHDLFGVPA